MAILKLEQLNKSATGPVRVLLALFFHVRPLKGQKGDKGMRKYTLASKEANEGVDLRNYRQIIEDAVHEVLPNAMVQVESDYYTVSPTPKQGDAVRIGRVICKSKLKEYCVQIPRLFSSVEIEEEKNDGTTKEKRTGGHW